MKHQDLYKLQDNFYIQLEEIRKNLNFPAIAPEVGSLIYFLIDSLQLKNVLEIGSGYGHSAYWALKSLSLEHITLTEKKESLYTIFQTLSFPHQEKIQYFLGDALDYIATHDLSLLNFILIDGQKSLYLKYIQKIEHKIASGTLILLDNTLLERSIAVSQSLEALHSYISTSSLFIKIFLPLSTGITLLRKI